MSVRRSSKKLDTHKEHLNCMLNGERFGVWPEHLHREGGLVERTYFWAHLFIFSHLEVLYLS